MTLSFLLLESALELVPESLRRHPAVRSWCRRFGRRPDDAILDSAYMWRAMKGLPDRERRGRPDIVHYFLLNVLESPAGREGLVDVYVHTIGGKMFYVEPGTRVPRSYTRFIGILAQLLRGEDTPHIHPLERGPHQIIGEKQRQGYAILGMSERGILAKPEEYLDRNSLVLIGGFPHGEFRGAYSAERWVRIGDDVYPSWVVGAEVTAGWERRFLFSW